MYITEKDRERHVVQKTRVMSQVKSPFFRPTLYINVVWQKHPTKTKHLNKQSSFWFWVMHCLFYLQLLNTVSKMLSCTVSKYNVVMQETIDIVNLQNILYTMNHRDVAPIFIFIGSTPESEFIFIFSFTCEKSH